MPGLQRSSLLPAKILVDHKHPDGPNVTHVRGTLVVNSLTNLRQLGQFERYRELLSSGDRERLTTAIAASWLPLELAMAHYAACDQLLDDECTAQAGAMMATQLSGTFLGAALRTSRAAGVQCMWTLLHQYGRLYDRLYRGGSVALLQTGPKDVVIETQGLATVRSRYFCGALLAYSRTLASLFAGSKAYVRAVRPRMPHPDSIAMAFSWV